MNRKRILAFAAGALGAVGLVLWIRSRSAEPEPPPYDLLDTSGVRGIAADDQAVYFGTELGLEKASGTLANWDVVQLEPAWLVALGPSAVWWTTPDEIRGIARADERKEPTVLSAKGVRALATHGEDLFFLAPGRLAQTKLKGEVRELARVALVADRPALLAATASAVFYGPTAECAVVRIRRAEAPEPACAAKSEPVQALTASGDRVFALTQSAILELGDAQPKELAKHGGASFSIHGDDAFVGSPEKLARVDLRTGSSTDVHASGASHVAVNRERIFWASGTELRALPRGAK